jgi:hypothetical protein
MNVQEVEGEAKNVLTGFSLLFRCFHSGFNLCVIDAACGRVAVYSGCISFITVLGFLDGF